MGTIGKERADFHGESRCYHGLRIGQCLGVLDEYAVLLARSRRMIRFDRSSGGDDETDCE